MNTIESSVSGAAPVGQNVPCLAKDHSLNAKEIRCKENMNNSRNGMISKRQMSERLQHAFSCYMRKDQSQK
jgi:hypothetical protein